MGVVSATVTRELSLMDAPGTALVVDHDKTRVLALAELVKGLGFEPESVNFGDHHAFQEDDLKGLVGKPIIMTEKDAVKCARFAGENSWYLRIHAQIPEAVVDAVAALGK